jgi:hypothetical protein
MGEGQPDVSSVGVSHTDHYVARSMERGKIMKAQIKINLDNDIFQLGGGIELGRLLHSLAEDVENNNACNLGSYIAMIDINGNRVGEFEILEN